MKLLSVLLLLLVAVGASAIDHECDSQCQQSVSTCKSQYGSRLSGDGHDFVGEVCRMWYLTHGIDGKAAASWSDVQEARRAVQGYLTAPSSFYSSTRLVGVLRRVRKVASYNRQEYYVGRIYTELEPFRPSTATRYDVAHTQGVKAGVGKEFSFDTYGLRALGRGVYAPETGVLVTFEKRNGRAVDIAPIASPLGGLTTKLLLKGQESLRRAEGHQVSVCAQLFARSASDMVARDYLNVQDAASMREFLREGEENVASCCPRERDCGDIPDGQAALRDWSIAMTEHVAKKSGGEFGEKYAHLSALYSKYNLGGSIQRNPVEVARQALDKAKQSARGQYREVAEPKLAAARANVAKAYVACDAVNDAVLAFRKVMNKASTRVMTDKLSKLAGAAVAADEAAVAALRIQ